MIRNRQLDRRARAYLHANCSQCHVAAGGGNSQMELEFTTASEKTRLFDVRPVHDTYGLPDARLIAPGQPGAIRPAPSNVAPRPWPYAAARDFDRGPRRDKTDQGLDWGDESQD